MMASAVADECHQHWQCYGGIKQNETGGLTGMNSNSYYDKQKLCS